MAFGQSGFGSREEREDPAGGLKSFAGARGAPSAPRNEGRELTQELATTAAGTALKEGAGGKLLGSLKTLGGTLGSAASGGAGLASKMAGSLGPQGAASLLPQVAPTAISSAMGGVGAAALPFAGPLALAALFF